MDRHAESRTVGCCPQCSANIPRGNLLIRYETSGGQSMFAECPECGDPVHPE